MCLKWVIAPEMFDNIYIPLYRKDTSIQQGTRIRHIPQRITEKPMEVYNPDQRIVINCDMLLASASYIQQ